MCNDFQNKQALSGKLQRFVDSQDRFGKKSFARMKIFQQKGAGYRSDRQFQNLIFRDRINAVLLKMYEEKVRLFAQKHNDKMLRIQAGFENAEKIQDEIIHTYRPYITNGIIGLPVEAWNIESVGRSLEY
jgi:hypothetical protein